MSSIMLGMRQRASVGTHPIPLKYLKMHQKLPFCSQNGMEELAGALMREDRRIMEAYN